MYNYSYFNQKLPTSTRRGMISLLPKAGKDQKFVKNKCSLTLLNTDYKVLANIFDNRLKTILPSIIDPCQTGFMKGRNIAHNMRKSLDIMEYCKGAKIPAVILSIDMQKAFDSIEYHAIYGSLKYFNFGQSFTQWVSLFFTEFQVCTQNLGYQSDWWTKSRSVNQGWPISPTLYLLIGELMTRKLKGNKGIHGIKIGESEILLSQFADDTDIYLPFDKAVINKDIEVLTDIETNIGLKVSYDKTTIYRIGSIANTDAKCYTIK